MPIDILFEVFSKLSPRDLLNLSRTTKAFRQLLLSRKAMSVWLNARLAIPYSPTCPADVSEPYWANLVYGEHKCQECGRINVRRIVFELRRRLCSACLTAGMIALQKNTKKLQEYDLELGRAATKQQYWKADVQAVATQLGRLRRNVAEDKPGAEDALESFKRSRLAYVKAVLKHSEECRTAQEKGATYRIDDTNAMRRLRFEQVYAKFIEIGYNDADVQEVIHEGHMRPGAFTDRAWAALRRQYEPVIIEQRERRLETENQDVRRARRDIINKMYQEYVLSKSPRERTVLPHASYMFDFAPVRELVNSDPHRKPSQEEYNSIKTKLPRLVAEWVASADAQLLDRYHARFHGMSSSDIIEVVDADASILDLATFVALCENHIWQRQSQVVVTFGKGEFLAHASHMIQPMYPTTLDFNCIPYVEFGAAAAVALVRLVGLDETTATPSLMDAMDARFVCEADHPSCRAGVRAGGSFKHVMDWRQCVAHHVRERRSAWHAPCVSTSTSWRKLNEDERIAVLKVEYARCVVRRQLWCCNHCLDPDTAMLYDSRRGALDHLSNVHGIADPVYDRDLFVDPGHGSFSYSPRPNVLICVESADGGKATGAPLAVYEQESMWF
ncbi:hypothetical protein BD413DRAFT_493370 [Trametes elegans]|nr:hypothetical protein BD413DRAFT_493370 [Trametes elegans]